MKKTLIFAVSAISLFFSCLSAAPLETESEVIEIMSVQQFEQELKTANSPVIVDFYAIWCGPCKRLLPIFESNATRLSGKVKFLKVNIDKVGELSRAYEIRAMPTALLFDASGKVVEMKTGMDQISDFLEQLGPIPSLSKEV